MTERVGFTEVLIDTTRKVKRIPQSEYLASGQIPVIDQGQEFCAGYYAEFNDAFEKIPAIVFGDHTRCVKYVDRPFVAGADGVKVLLCKRKEDNPKYFYYALKAANVPSLGYSRHFKLVKALTFADATRERQEAIVARLDSLEQLIAERHAEIDRLDDLVKSRFVEMFGDPATNPFGFSTAGLTELGTCKNGMNFHSSDSGVELPCLGVADFKDLSFIDGVEGLSTVSLNERPSEDYLLNDGDIVFVRSNGNKELVGRCLTIYPHGVDAVFSGFCIRLRLSNDNVRVPYLVWALKQPTIRSQMFGRGANVQNLNQKILSNVCVPIPPIEMQDEFLAFASQVDKSRFAVQQAIEQLELLKAKLMQEYFG